MNKLVLFLLLSLSIFGSEFDGLWDFHENYHFRGKKYSKLQIIGKEVFLVLDSNSVKNMETDWGVKGHLALKDLITFEKIWNSEKSEWEKTKSDELVLGIEKLKDDRLNLKNFSNNKIIELVRSNELEVNIYPEIKDGIVKGNFVIDQFTSDRVLNMIVEADILTVKNSYIEDLVMPNLVKINKRFYVMNNRKLKSIVLPKLIKVENDLTIFNNKCIEKVELNSKLDAKGIGIMGSDALKRFELQVEKTGALSISGKNLVEINLDNLKEVSGLSISGTKHMRALKINSLKKAYQIQIAYNYELKDIEFKNLITVSDDIVFEKNPKLEKVDIRNIQKVEAKVTRYNIWSYENESIPVVIVSKKVKDKFDNGEYKLRDVIIQSF